MSLKPIVDALGGDLYDRGLRASIPGPGHSSADRSVSLLLQGERVVVHSFGRSGWQEVLDHLRLLRLIDAANKPGSIALAQSGSPAAPASRLERRDAALRLWDAGRPIVGTPSERYFRLRAISGALPGPDVLRHNAHTPIAAYRGGRGQRPALLAAIRTPDGDFTGVEVTYLMADGGRAPDLRLSRKTIGPAPSGCAVRLDPAAEEMLVGEGVCTTRSASEWFGLPGWALMSTRNLRAWRPPLGVRFVLIAADPGPDGETSAERLRSVLVRDGVESAVALPPPRFEDWNHWAMRRLGSGEERKGPGERAQGKDDPRPALEPETHDPTYDIRAGNH